MILETITLTNFGVYAGSQEVILAPPDAAKPIILFGAMNGAGKTTLLDAVQLALYGAKARCSGRRGRQGYHDYLKSMISRGKDPADGAAVELGFSRNVDGVAHHYHLVRSWRDTVKGVGESVAVTCDGEADPTLSDHWEEYIEGYIPAGIAHLFFFDAEQITDLADGERASEILGTAIHTLLGLDLVDRLETDLTALERRKRAEATHGQENQKVRHAEEELVRLLHLHEIANQQLGTLGNELGQLQKELDKCEDKFRREGGDLFLRRSELESEKARFEAEIHREESELREMAAGLAPLLLIPNLLEETEKQACREVKVHRSLVLASALTERDAELLQTLGQTKLPAKHLAQIERLLQEDRETRKEILSEPCFLEADDHLASTLHHLRSSVLPELKKRITAKIEIVNSIKERLTRVETALVRVPTEDAIAGLLEKMNDQRKTCQDKQAQLSAHADKLRVIGQQAAEADRIYKRELGSEVDVRIGQDNSARVLQHSARVRQTLSQFRETIIHRHAQHLEVLVLECFRHLLRKGNLITGLKIDPNTFGLELTGNDGKPLAFDQLSAGERQLLATSLLWGLARASGRPLPTIIDTPLGRLDSSHRRHLLDRYFPVASHQVILLSTDEEIDQASLARLQPYIGRSYQLRFDDESQSTKITPGYFWDNEATT